MALWNGPSRKQHISKDSPGLTAALFSFIVVLATACTATAQVTLPADGGSTGIVATTFESGFTITTATGVVVTVNETPFTKTVDATGESVDFGHNIRQGT